MEIPQAIAIFDMHIVNHMLIYVMADNLDRKVVFPRKLGTGATRYGTFRLLPDHRRLFDPMALSFIANPRYHMVSAREVSKAVE